MLVDSRKLKTLPQSKNSTQQHLAHVYSLSLRTIQRIEKDGVASNETVAAYSAIFELQASELLISIEQFDNANRDISRLNTSPLQVGAFLLVGLSSFAAGIGLTL